MAPLPDDSPAFSVPLEEPLWQPPRKFQDRVWLHVLLFVLTILTTMLAGADYYASWITRIGALPLNESFGQLYLHGWMYSATVLAILGSHEFGHYFACRYYDVDASLPFFLPMPLVATGTLGAVIRIREPIHSKRLYFDIGIAGPIAGFVVAVAALALGMYWSEVIPHVSTPGTGLEYGEPPIFQLFSWLNFGTIADGYALNCHPLVWGAWFGFLATALNLIPFGQLDGGHVTYALLGRESSRVSVVVIACCLALTVLSLSWAVWTMLLIAMALRIGIHHPRTFDESVPIGTGRVLVALFALVMFVLSFTLVPVQVL